MHFGGVRERSDRSDVSVVVVSENESDSVSGSRSDDGGLRTGTCTVNVSLDSFRGEDVILTPRSISPSYTRSSSSVAPLVSPVSSSLCRTSSTALSLVLPVHPSSGVQAMRSLPCLYSDCKGFIIYYM